MGNRQSKTSEERLSEIFSEFTEEEKATLLKVFDEFASDNSNIQKPKITEVTAANIKNHLPSTIGESLKNGFVTYFQSISVESSISTKIIEKTSYQISPSNVITKLGFVSAIHNLVKTLPIDRSQAIYIIGQLSQGTLIDFVREVVQASMAYWFEGSYSPKQRKLKKEVNKLFKDDIYLINLIILNPKIKHKESEDDELLSNFIKEAEINGSFDHYRFMNWYTNNLLFQHLFNILVNRLFLYQTIPYHSDDEMYKLRSSNQISSEIYSPYKLMEFSNLLSPADYYILNDNLPLDCKNTKHTMLFSSVRDGGSWNAFVNSLIYQGSTYIIIRDKDGYIFGGFAYEDWKQNPKFYGDRKNFLFSIRPKLRCYPTTSYNNNFQYLNFGVKTLPNGLAMGGQFDYCGLWIDSDFIHGHSKAAPLSSTYASPRLSKQEDFLIDEVEVWSVRPTQVDLDEVQKGPKRSAFDSHPGELDLLEMATGRKMYSKEVREPDLNLDDDE
ncbi:TLD-domain-containing protein [Gigaspora margarita]|uniref:MTOR-associated protein MEAK7 n=1 Tax=Gigaspora margarita TaxID=4874 RepID=A0A8H4AQK8_GIGMA|nr:TLD-domain-containing protein [Gigaspora margarita]